MLCLAAVVGVLVVVVVVIVDTRAGCCIYENSIGFVVVNKTKQNETKQNKTAPHIKTKMKRNETKLELASAYLVKIVAFHCLPFQLCATQRMNNVVMKWAHRQHQQKQQQ